MNDHALPLMQALGFTRQPFDKNLPLKHLFLSKQIKELFRHLEQFLHRRGIALVTGEIGTGKSTTIRAFVEQLEKNLYNIAYIADPTIGIRGILNSIAIQLNLEGGYFKWQLLEKLKHFIEGLVLSLPKEIPMTLTKLPCSSSMKLNCYLPKHSKNSDSSPTLKSTPKHHSTSSWPPNPTSTKPSNFTP